MRLEIRNEAIQRPAAPISHREGRPLGAGEGELAMALKQRRSFASGNLPGRLVLYEDRIAA